MYVLDNFLGVVINTTSDHLGGDEHLFPSSKELHHELPVKWIFY